MTERPQPYIPPVRRAATDPSWDPDITLEYKQYDVHVVSIETWFTKILNFRIANYTLTDRCSIIKAIHAFTKAHPHYNTWVRHFPEYGWCCLNADMHRLFSRVNATWVVTRAVQIKTAETRAAAARAVAVAAAKKKDH
jgi:hypothetical protein